MNRQILQLTHDTQIDMHDESSLSLHNDTHGVQLANQKPRRQMTKVPEHASSYKKPLYYRIVQ